MVAKPTTEMCWKTRWWSSTTKIPNESLGCGGRGVTRRSPRRRGARRRPRPAGAAGAPGSRSPAPRNPHPCCSCFCLPRICTDSAWARGRVTTRGPLRNPVSLKAGPEASPKDVWTQKRGRRQGLRCCRRLKQMCLYENCLDHFSRPPSCPRRRGLQGLAAPGSCRRSR